MEISVHELADGAMVAGKAGEDDVLLARRGDEFFAVTAFCTHYHGPLAEGLLVGESVRCPWHHACFDLRTGAALGAPAMRPLQTYRVVREGDRVRVEGAQRIVIAGGGAAGAFAAAELKRLGFAGSITLITREEQVPYDKPNLSKDYLAGKAPVEWIPLKSAEEYRSEGVELRLGAAIASIDVDGRAVLLADGARVPYDRLILATGASPRRLDIPSDPAAHLFYLRTWSDADALISATAGATHAVVIGASFIGLEVAASLRQRGLEVTVVGPEERPLERVLGRELGDFVRGLHERHGVRFRLGRTPAGIRPDSVVLDDGSSERADFVVIGVGVVPETSLAEKAGLAVDNGIVVDEYLRTTAPDIYAAGDVARFRGRGGASMRIEHWAAAGRQGQAAARNAMGRNQPYRDVPFFWSQHYDLVFACVGHASRADHVEIFGSFASTNGAAVYRENGRITAVVTLFRDDVSLAVEAAMERDASDEELTDIVARAFAG